MNFHAYSLSFLELFIVNLTMLFTVGYLLLRIHQEIDNKNKNLILFSLIIFATVGRVLLGPLPNIQPVTTVMILIGLFYGIKESIISSCMIVFLSNLYLGGGIWNIYQTIGWACTGIISYKLSNFLIKNETLLLGRMCWLGFFSAFIFDWIVSLSIIHSVGYDILPIYILNGLPFDVLHASGNIFFLAWISESVYETIQNCNQEKTNFIINKEKSHNPVS